MGAAIEWSVEHMEEHRHRLQMLCDKLIDGIAADRRDFESIRGVSASSQFSHPLSHRFNHSIRLVFLRKTQKYE